MSLELRYKSLFPSHLDRILSELEKYLPWKFEEPPTSLLTDNDEK